jgi:hypothetical protein
MINNRHLIPARLYLQENFLLNVYYSQNCCQDINQSQREADHSARSTSELNNNGATYPLPNLSARLKKGPIHLQVGSECAFHFTY